MEDFISFFLILVCLTILYLYLETKALDVTYIKSGFDNKEYLVRNLPDKEEAALLLSNIKNNLTTIVNDLVKNPRDAKIEDIQRLQKNYRPDNISESSPNNSYTSYSVNKGEKIVFCLRSKDEKTKGKLEPLNTMMFVAIHELAHLMTESIGHTPEFWENMKYLLKVGIELGIYKKEDYVSNPVKYCGVDITNSPLD